MDSKVNDFTPTGVREEGPYENDRNKDAADLFKAIVREAYGVTDVIVAHHIVYVQEEKRADGFEYQVVQEVPSADALIFDHDVARKLWGADWQAALTRLALEPVATRDQLLRTMYEGRATTAAPAESSRASAVPAPRTYGYLNPRPMDPARCAASVQPPGLEGIGSSHQCYRKPGHGPHGLYCRQHGAIAWGSGGAPRCDDPGAHGPGCQCDGGEPVL